jgi:hypothetical protein
MLSLIERDILKRSHEMKREMFVELTYATSKVGVDVEETPVLLAEQIGEENFVNAYHTKIGSYVCHTHINNNPPSDMDYVMMLKSTLCSASIEHRVITDELVYSYSCSTALFLELRGYVAERNALKIKTKLDDIRERIAILNAEYKKTGLLDQKRSLYVRAVKDLGINLSIRSWHSSETSLS